MAYFQEGNLRAGIPAADASAKAGHAYTFDGDTLTLAATAGQRIDGILIDDPVWSTDATRRQSGTIQVRDVARVKAGAAITKGALLAVQVTTGRLITAASGNHVVGKALETATAADQLIAAEIVYLGIVP
jgi:hypothetical protein